jgi:guanosine-3',5'-bis(diphosphate) 3'-pyrophosphohydrolase
VSNKLQDIVAVVQEYHPSADLDLLRKAYAFVRDKHQAQTRDSGEPYINHLAEVAYLAAKLHLDIPSIVTALLHDTVEDTNTSLKDISQEFGQDIAELVDGVTKLNQVNFSSREEAQAENFRKMLLAMSRDIRVLLVKLCDRTHNMRTLEFLSEARRTRIAQETLDIYAPLAHRLGIHWMKSELEDLSFRYLKSELYNSIKQQISQKKKERERYIHEVVELISLELEQNSIKGEVSGRPKHFYSIYKKMERHNLSFEELYDLIAFRIMVESTIDCYAALGAIHAAWKPIPGRFKDYIAMPKPNRYQSLHTSVIGPQGHRIEIQIRTREMHDIAERGIAAHWIYKDSGGGKMSHNTSQNKQFSWLNDLVESGKMLRDPHEFMSLVKEDLFAHEVFVFSPKGDLISLAAGATPVDFAYHIHSQVGHYCSGARVNGQQVSLGHRLKNGDTVEIITSPHHTPNRDWLSFVQTTKAKQRVRAWLKSEERKRSITIGKELLAKDLRRSKHTLDEFQKNGQLEEVIASLVLKDLETLFAEIGYGKITTAQVVSRLLPDAAPQEDEIESTLQKIFQNAAKTTREQTGVKVSGLDDVVFRFARCCEPLPGDELVGYITRGRGVTIHSRRCSETLSFDPQRVIPVSWEDNAKATRRVLIKVICVDRVGILAAMSQVISAHGANIVAAHVKAQPDGKAENSFELTIENAPQLEAVWRGLENIQGVLRIEREKRSEQKV